MAEIVCGLAASHSPLLNSPPETWPLHAQRDRNNPHLIGRDGRVHSFAELERTADPALARELRPEVMAERHAACQRAIGELAETLAAVAPDAVVVIGDDQDEFFPHDEGMPAMCVYWGEDMQSFPPESEDLDASVGGGFGYVVERRAERAALRLGPSMRVAAWGYYADRPTRYPCDAELGRGVIEHLTGAGFDVAHTRVQREGFPLGHAFGFVVRRLMGERVIPMVPVMVNTYFAPNQPTADRCHALGTALRGALLAIGGGRRIAVIASGGLSHFVIDETLDRAFLEALRGGSRQALAAVPEGRLRSGTSELKNWIAAAACVEGLVPRIIDYVPCYRSPAGTGCAMAFATWLNPAG